MAIAGYARSHSQDPLEDLSLSCCNEEAPGPMIATLKDSLLLAAELMWKFDATVYALYHPPKATLEEDSWLTMMFVCVKPGY